MKGTPSSQQKRFELRNGAPGFPGAWLGVVNESSDPSAIPVNSLQRARNMRYRQGEWWVRPGLKPLATGFHDGNACIHHICSYRTDPIRLWIVVFGCLSGYKGGTIFNFDPEQDPKLQAYAQYFAEVDRKVSLSVFDGRLYFGEGSNLRAVTIAKVPYGTAINDLSATFDTSVFSFPGFRISALQEFDGKLFIALDGGAGASKIAVWDGLSVSDGVTVPFDLDTIDPVTRFGLWRSKLIAGFGPATGHIRVRDEGPIAGVWATVAAGGVAATESPSIVSFKDKAYIAGGGQDLFVYDGATLTVARNLPNAFAIGGVMSVAVFNNDLYYAWNDDAVDHAKLGRYDPNSGPGSIEWQDDWKDFTAQIANLTLVQSLCAYRDILFASFCNGGINFASNLPIGMLSSPGIDTQNAWDDYTQAEPLVGGSDFPIIDLMVY